MNSQQFETSDLGLATALVSSGNSLFSVDKSNPRRVIFIFNQTSELSDKVDQYWSGQLHVAANSYMDHVKYLKAMIYS